MITRFAKAGSSQPQPYQWDKGDNAGLQPFFREGGASPDVWEDADSLLKARDVDQVLSRLRSMPGNRLSEALLAGFAAPLAVRLLQAFKAGPSRARLLHLLAHSRTADLSLGARAVLIRAMASEGRRLRPGSARAIADVLLATHGRDLSRLKRALDVGGGRHDLFRLVYRDVGGAPAAQAELLQHLALEAAAVRTGLSTEGRLGLQLVSDFDDTLRQGWLDKRVPSGSPYPGAKAFVGALLGRSALHHGAAADWFLYDGQSDEDAATDRSGRWGSLSALETLAVAGGWMRTHRGGDAAEAAALSNMVPRQDEDAAAAAAVADTAAGREEPVVARAQAGSKQMHEGLAGAAGDGGLVASAAAGWREAAPVTTRTPADEPGGHLVVLTARPAGAFDVLRKRTLEGLGWLSPPSATVLAGSLASGISTAAIAERKASNLTLQLALWRECCAVFLGDSGQGDAAVAAEALARHSKQVLAAFVHDVNEASPTTGDGSHKDALREAGVILFRTYPEAAASALRLGLIDADDARAVACAAVEEAQALLAGGPRAEDDRLDADAGDAGSRAGAAGAGGTVGGSKRRLQHERYVKDVLRDAAVLLREL